MRGECLLSLLPTQARSDLHDAAVASCRWPTPVLACLPSYPIPLCSAYSAASDPLLAFVNSYVGSQPAAALHQQQAALTPGSSGGSGALELRTDARVWEVQWPELTILRAVGHGSFGSVYLAEWNQVPVAVKVLIGKGECACLRVRECSCWTTVCTRRHDAMAARL